VTFDVWETLLHDPLGAEVERVAWRAVEMSRILREGGYPVEPSEIVEAYTVALPEMERTWASAVDFDTPEQVGRVLARLPGDPRPTLDADLAARLSRAYASAALAYPPEIWPDSRPTLEEVARRGYRIGLVCNTGRTPGWVLRELFAGWGILDRFEALAFSNETGVRKPDPAIFRGVLDRLGVTPEVAVHVGDDAISDIAGAKSIGMRAVIVCAECPATPVPPDGRISRLGELIPLLDEWSGD
jgi:putative hydrolase of the HAD superfamily